MVSEEEREPEEWEEENIPEEDAPENLKRKWAVEDHFQREAVPCPSCGKLVSPSILTCIYCGKAVCEDTGFLGKLVKWFKSIF